jgi:hypothetical protein
MRVFLKCDPEQEEVRIQVWQAETHEGNARKQVIRLAAGMSWRGYAYEALLRLGPGHHELPIPCPTPLESPRRHRGRKPKRPLRR